MTGRPAPDRLSEDAIVGWRMWRVADDGALDSMFSFREGSWAPLAANPAGCNRTLALSEPPHPTPSLDCRCGLHAWRERAFVEHELRGMSGWHPGTALAIGSCSMWGRVIEHQRGYRAQYAYPLELWVVEPNQRLTPAVSAAYGVPTGSVGRVQRSQLWRPGHGR